MSFPHGKSFENAVTGHLKDKGFKVSKDDNWDRTCKIDFVVDRFPNYLKKVAIGVQLTLRGDESRKLSEFIAKNDPTNIGNITVADKALYLEYEEAVDFYQGGAELVANILYAFQFDEQFSSTKVWGVKVQANTNSIGYKFFDPRMIIVQNSVASQKSPSQSPPVSNIKDVATAVQSAMVNKPHTEGKKESELEGTLHTYDTDKGFGYIDAQDGFTYFMHLNDVTDYTLSSQLRAYMNRGKVQIQDHVLFTDGGKTRPNATYKQAKNIRLLLNG
jgi:hypothetical protein